MSNAGSLQIKKTAERVHCRALWNYCYAMEGGL